jgi:hypothetical protein
MGVGSNTNEIVRHLVIKEAEREIKYMSDKVAPPYFVGDWQLYRECKNLSIF